MGMKAWLLDRIGDGIDALRLNETDDPAPAPGEAVLKLDFAALNPADRYTAEGQYPARPALPHILGRDGIGSVVAVGEGVTNVRVGDRRLIVRSEIGVNRRGTLAQRVAVPVESLVPVPEGWSDEQSAGATLVYLTAWQAIKQWGDLPELSLVLVSGASGGVGVAVGHLASAMGHGVIGLSRSAEKAQALLQQGFDFVLDPTDTGWVKSLKEKIAKRRVDLAIDNIGGAAFNQIMETLGENGRISCVGRLAGPVPEFNTASLFFRRLQIRGVGVYSYKPQESAAIWPKIVELMHRRQYRPLVDRVFTFTDIAGAFARLREGPMGKVLVKIPN
jgi:NADPH2:quinone reductase